MNSFHDIIASNIENAKRNSESTKVMSETKDNKYEFYLPYRPSEFATDIRNDLIEASKIINSAQSDRIRMFYFTLGSSRPFYKSTERILEARHLFSPDEYCEYQTVNEIGNAYLSAIQEDLSRENIIVKFAYGHQMDRGPKIADIISSHMYYPVDYDNSRDLDWDYHPPLFQVAATIAFQDDVIDPYCKQKYFPEFAFELPQLGFLVEYQF